jgi:hypothetical protein
MSLIRQNSIAPTTWPDPMNPQGAATGRRGRSMPSIVEVWETATVGIINAVSTVFWRQDGRFAPSVFKRPDEQACDCRFRCGVVALP